ncbi:hypothetical protein V8D89_006691 [Ganoderma adspersum]
MWLLSTDRAELRYFSRNFDADGGYAILSHTWERDEETFQDVEAIGERCRREGTNPRDFVHEKIRNCCLLAEKEGYRWVWIDSCCIDKTSSSELSEAINSMYQWYTEAEVCYAYLADVPGDCVLDAADSAFRKSRWHTRGWTLQELIAPDFVIFLSGNWRELGNKAALAKLLQEITRVDSRVLTRELKPAHWSIAVRMSWASSRKTTRVEDEAYCLMGLFGVSMPTNYGEGRRAFVRLQYEIMQHDSDMSLFAFGYRVNQDDSSLTFHAQDQVNHPWQYLMADSPRELDYGFGYIPDLGTNAKQQYPPPLDSTATGPFDGVELPSATVTSYGIQFRLPVHEADDITIAVTLCQGSGRHYGLFLTRDNKGKDPKRPRYFTGCVYQRPSTTGSATYVARLADLGDDLYNLTFNGKPVQASWRTIYVLPTASDLDSSSATAPNLILNCGPTSRFRVPRWLIARFTTLQFEVDQVRNTDALQVVRILHRSKARIFVSLGACTGQRDGEGDSPNDDPKSDNAEAENVKPPQLWAKVDVVSLIDMDSFTHDCATDHLSSASWATQSKVFGDAERKVRLSFSPSTRMSESVLVIHTELFGSTFEEMLRESNISIPSLDDLRKGNFQPAPVPLSAPYVERIESAGPSSRSASPRPAPTRRGTEEQRQDKAREDDGKTAIVDVTLQGHDANGVGPAVPDSKVPKRPDTISRWTRRMLSMSWRGDRSPDRT